MGLAATEIADEAHASCERGTGLTSSSDRSCAHALGVDAPTAKTSATTASLLRVRGRPQVSSLLLMLFTLHPERLRSEEHTSELQSRLHLVCRLLLEKNKNTVYTLSTLQ